VEHVDRRVVHDELAVDAGDVDDDVLVGVGDHVPGVTRIGLAEDPVDLAIGRLQLLGKQHQQAPLVGGPVAGRRPRAEG
jgi:hypothetical protein